MLLETLHGDGGPRVLALWDGVPTELSSITEGLSPSLVRVTPAASCSEAHKISEGRLGFNWTWC